MHFKIAAVCAIAIVGTGVQATTQRPAPGETRLKITCDLIKKNVEEGTTENTLHPRSIYYKVINRMNSYIHKLSTPPPAEYLHVTVGSGVLSVSSSGADVILARFPNEGNNLSAFGLTPSLVKSIAIPNDLKEWPTSALSGCTALEKITVFGEETENGAITLGREHNLHELPNLSAIHLPSTITAIGNGIWAQHNSVPVFPRSLVSITFSKRLKVCGSVSFPDCQKLKNPDFSRCERLEDSGQDVFFYCYCITSVDFSNCSSLRTLGFATFSETSLTTLVVPPSVTALQAFFACTYDTGGRELLPTFKTLIWKGRTERLPIVEADYPSQGISNKAFGSVLFDQLVQEGRITEIFVP